MRDASWYDIAPHEAVRLMCCQASVGQVESVPGAVWDSSHPATTPVTCGAAMDEPDLTEYWSPETAVHVDFTHEPGAKMSTHRPQLV